MNTTFEWVEATQENLPNKEGKYIIKTSTYSKLLNKISYGNVLEARMFINKKGEKTFDANNQVVTHFLKQIL